MMKSNLVRMEGFEAILEVEFESLDFEKAIIDSYLAFEPDAPSNPELVILSTEALISRHSKALQITQRAIETLFARHYAELTKRHELIPLADPYVQPVSGEIGDPLDLLVKIKAVGGISELQVEGVEAHYVEVFAEGTEVDDRLQYARAYYQVETDEELVAKMGLYGNCEEMRESMTQSLVNYIDGVNLQAKREAAAKALIKANPFEMPVDALDSFVDSEIAKLANQVGSEELHRRLDDGPFDARALRALIKSDVGHIPQLNVLLRAYSANMTFHITDEHRLREIQAKRAQSVRSHAMEPVEETLEEVKRDPALLASLDEQVKLNMALDAAMDSMKFKVKARIPLREGSPRYVRAAF